MASFCSFWAILLSFALMAAHPCPSLAQASPLSTHVSTISASPASSEEAPMLSPDIEPLFPTPRGVASSPSQSSLPTIPSSPSPPNPQVLDTPGSVLAFPPLASMPAASHASSRSLISVSYLASLVIFLMQFRFV
ncbi:classical arabinogalactan protein 26-like [Neltuma alba]|uniref:classical arabinogalactan protein 26-like n=1 Tax=Neltuma alba TaxID=207710 RepID=UPI0010A4F0A4|nr:classical arabinogalactan protein 26-like [Prosopis alba]